MNITEWIQDTLYPTLFEVIDRVFSEHNFKQRSGNWISNTYLLTGDTHQRVDKTKVTRKVPGRILEQGGDSLTLIDYVMQRDNVEFIEALKTLADSVALEIPNFNNGDYQRYKEKNELLEICNSYFAFCLDHSRGAAQVKEYLNSRSYSDDTIKEMDLGYIPSQEDLFKHLQQCAPTHTRQANAHLLKE